MSEVVHQPEQHRFVVEQDGQQAVLQYRLLGEQGVDFTRVFVPESLRGGAIAADLVTAGLGWARAQNYAIEATCSYVQMKLQRGC